MRDLRNTAITHMREKGTATIVASKFAGHSETMSDHYFQLTDTAAQQAILSLGEPSRDAAWDAGRRRQYRQSVSA